MIYVECYPDFALVKSLTNVTRRDIIHEFKGRSEICKRLRKQKNSIGLVDEDPLSTPSLYMKEATIEQDFPEYGVKLLYHNQTANRLIVLCPRLEEWVLKATREADIDVRKYGLPNDASRLHRHININLDKFEKLLEDLKNSSNRLKTLKRLLERPQ